VHVTTTGPGRTPVVFNVAVVPIAVTLPLLLLNPTVTGCELLVDAVIVTVPPSSTVGDPAVQLTCGGAAATNVCTEDALLE
jgi:hypothetical protein